MDKFKESLNALFQLLETKGLQERGQPLSEKSSMAEERLSHEETISSMKMGFDRERLSLMTELEVARACVDSLTAEVERLISSPPNPQPEPPPPQSPPISWEEEKLAIDLKALDDRYKLLEKQEEMRKIEMEAALREARDCILICESVQEKMVRLEGGEIDRKRAEEEKKRLELLIDEKARQIEAGRERERALETRVEEFEKSKALGEELANAYTEMRQTCVMQQELLRKRDNDLNFK